MGDDGMVDGVNTGRLYRITMNETGVWQGLPMEYARLQTEWPSKEGWNHNWKRS
jgi:large subunit ribosomal protein L40